MSQITTKSTGGGGGGVTSVVGGHDINVTTAAGVATVNVNNAITLGDVSAIPAGSDAVTATTGDINIVAGNLKIPATNSTGTAGVITMAGNRFMHAWGTSGIASQNTFLGWQAGQFATIGNSYAAFGYQAAQQSSANNSTAVGTQAQQLGKGAQNTAVGAFAQQDMTGANSNPFGNTAIGYFSQRVNNRSANTGVGYQAQSTVNGDNNTSIGSFSQHGITGDHNTAVGTDTQNLLNGANNTTIGSNSQQNLATGSFNLSCGYQSGNAWNGSESNNITLNHIGIVGDQNICRIGSGTGTGSRQLNATFISGINGIVVTGVPILVSATDQLGIATSSEKYKENIKDMGSDSSVLMQMRPVSFNYKKDELKAKQWGMIAEEVEKFAPELCHYNKDGSLMTLYYQHFVPMLVNEVQKLRKELDELKNNYKKT